MNYITTDRNEKIEFQARELRKRVFRERFGENSSVDLLEVLEPGIALDLLGFSVQSADSLGQFSDGGRISEVAGLIDPIGREVYISRRFDEVHRRFTTAHELGHAVMQPNGTTKHRDRPLAGPAAYRSFEEAEADRFASAYLMPAKIVTDRFLERFGRVPFELDDDARFFLFGTTARRKNESNTPRTISLALAQAIEYGGRRFKSLYAEFCVSPTTLAIRLEELGLVRCGD